MEFTGPKPTGTSRQSKPVTERRQSVRLKVHSPAYANLDESSKDGGARTERNFGHQRRRNVDSNIVSPEVDSNLNSAWIFPRPRRGYAPPAR